ncbi:MAG TPA: hypothetical protein VGR47_20360 [Terracidiphilus sp.]|nr:hypothetical protein [Terracidiphilus sp.]
MMVLPSKVFRRKKVGQPKAITGLWFGVNISIDGPTGVDYPSAE